MRREALGAKAGADMQSAGWSLTLKVDLKSANYQCALEVACKYGSLVKAGDMSARSKLAKTGVYMQLVFCFLFSSSVPCACSRLTLNSHTNAVHSHDSSTRPGECATHWAKRKLWHEPKI